MRTLTALLLLASVARADVPLDLILIIEKERPATPAPTPPAPVVQPAPTPPVATRLGYPVRGNWWTGCPGWQHLATGEHAGKFDNVWLTTLSWAELQSLHSDDHEGRVNWSRVQRPIARRVGGYYRWECDGQSCGWKWHPDEATRAVPQRRRVFR